MLKKFFRFMKKHDVVTLVVAFVMGTAGTNLIDSLVQNILVPLATPLLTAESWNTATVSIGGVDITYGAFLAELINFVILAVIVFVVVQNLPKPIKPKKRAHPFA